jgi:hypothetical protein
LGGICKIGWHWFWIWMGNGRMDEVEGKPVTNYFNLLYNLGKSRIVENIFKYLVHGNGNWEIKKLING